MQVINQLTEGSCCYMDVLHVYISLTHKRAQKVHKDKLFTISQREYPI